jgi:hypothetical protein
MRWVAGKHWGLTLWRSFAVVAPSISFDRGFLIELLSRLKIACDFQGKTCLGTSQ